MNEVKSIRHWTPRYIADKINVWIYEQKYPDHPWLTRDAVAILSDYLKDTDVGLEFGSGRSTIWFSKRVSKLISVEHDPVWYEKVENRLSDGKVTNCSYYLCPAEPDSRHEDDRPDSAYVRVAMEIPDVSLDFVLVDGIYRGSCAVAVLEKLRPGGILIVDNVNWYLPNASRAPASRRLRDGTASEVWTRFQKSVEGWRRIWTSDGVSDTAFFFKPCAQMVEKK